MSQQNLATYLLNLVTAIRLGAKPRDMCNVYHKDKPVVGTNVGAVFIARYQSNYMYIL